MSTTECVLSLQNVLSYQRVRCDKLHVQTERPSAGSLMCACIHIYVWMCACVVSCDSCDTYAGFGLYPHTHANVNGSLLPYALVSFDSSDPYAGFGLQPHTLVELRVSGSIRGFWQEAFARADVRCARVLIGLISTEENTFYVQRTHSIWRISVC